MKVYSFRVIAIHMHLGTPTGEFPDRWVKALPRSFRLKKDVYVQRDDQMQQNVWYSLIEKYSMPHKVDFLRHLTCPLWNLTNTLVK